MRSGKWTMSDNKRFAPPAAARTGEMSHFVILAAAGGANNSMERKSLPSVATSLRFALCTKNAMNCIFRCQGSAHVAPVMLLFTCQNPRMASSLLT